MPRQPTRHQRFEWLCKTRSDRFPIWLIQSGIGIREILSTSCNPAVTRKPVVRAAASPPCVGVWWIALVTAFLNPSDPKPTSRRMWLRG